MEFVLRLLLVAVCVLPLAGPRLGAGMMPLESSPSNRPIEEEDESERADAEQRDAELRIERRFESRHRSAGRLPLAERTSHRFTSNPIPAADPFRNGLGTHYRC